MNGFLRLQKCLSIVTPIAKINLLMLIVNFQLSMKVFNSILEPIRKHIEYARSHLCISKIRFWSIEIRIPNVLAWKHSFTAK